jgi:type II secretion system protein J
LVEAIVSLFVFSLVASGSVMLLMQSVDTQDRVGRAQLSLREVQSARALLAADLAQYVARATREADGSVRPQFIGGDGEAALAFVRAAAEPDPGGGGLTRLALVEYVVEDGAVIRRSREQLDAGPDTVMSERVIITDAGEARFEFFDGVAWRQQWLAGASGSPPRAVALVFQSPRYGEVRIEALVGLGV